jgi:hypothetical protein
VLVSTGTEYWRVGEITLVVHGDGAVQVRHRRSGEHTAYADRLDEDELASLGDELVRHGFATLAPERTHTRPDEHLVTLELRRGDEVLRHEQIPRGDERLEGILAIHRRLVERATEGALPFGAAAAPR